MVKVCIKKTTNELLMIVILSVLLGISMPFCNILLSIALFLILFVNLHLFLKKLSGFFRELNLFRERDLENLQKAVDTPEDIS